MFIDHCKAIYEGRNYGTKRKSFNNHGKFFLFHLRSSFYSPVIQIFVIFALSLHKTMVKNKSWYFEKIIDTFKHKEDLILNIKNWKSLCKKYVEKVHQKLVTGPLGKKPTKTQSMHEKFFERGLSKSFKKLTLFFLVNPLPFYGHNYKKQRDLKIVTSFSSGCKIVQKKIPFRQFSCSYFEVVSELFQKLYLLIHASQFTVS